MSSDFKWVAYFRRDVLVMLKFNTHESILGFYSVIEKLSNLIVELGKSLYDN